MLINAVETFTERLRLHQYAANQAIKRRPIAETLRGTGVQLVVGTASWIDRAARTVTQGIALGRHDAVAFSNYPKDRPHRPIFTGWIAVRLRELFVNLAAGFPDLERRRPGVFIWPGKGRVLETAAESTPWSCST